MKHNIQVIIMTGLLLTACLSYGTITYQQGIYEGESRGFRGSVKVKLFISETGIEDIEITENSEDAWAVLAMEEMRELVLESGSTDIDVVSGATISCSAFLNATENALSGAVIK